MKSDTGVAVPLRNITNVQTTPSTRHDRPTSATSDPNQTVDQLRLVNNYVCSHLCMTLGNLGLELGLVHSQPQLDPTFVCSQVPCLGKSYCINS